MAHDRDSIERDISTARYALNQHLSEAEDKAREVMDWRTHYRKNPVPLLVAAAVAGMWLSGLVGSRGRRPQFAAGDGPANAEASRAFTLANSAVEGLAEAFIAAGAMKVAEYVEPWIPGIHKEFSRRQG